MLIYKVLGLSLIGQWNQLLGNISFVRVLRNKLCLRVALSLVIGTVNNLHIGFKCGSINFYMQRKQTAKYQHHGITPLRFIKLRNHFPVIKSCDKFSQLNKTSKLIQARNFAFTFPVVLVCILCKIRSFILEIYEDLKNCLFADTRPWVWD